MRGRGRGHWGGPMNSSVLEGASDSRESRGQPAPGRSQPIPRNRSRWGNSFRGGNYDNIYNRSYDDYHYRNVNYRGAFDQQGYPNYQYPPVPPNAGFAVTSQFEFYAGTQYPVYSSGSGYQNFDEEGRVIQDTQRDEGQDKEQGHRAAQREGHRKSGEPRRKAPSNPPSETAPATPTKNSESDLFYIDPSPTPLPGQKQKKKKKKDKDKQLLETPPSIGVSEEEAIRAQKLKMAQRLAQKRFRSISTSSTLTSLPTEQLKLLEKVADANKPLPSPLMSPAQSIHSQEEPDQPIGILGAEQPEIEVKDEEEPEDEIVVVAPPPKAPPPVIDLDDPVKSPEQTQPTHRNSSHPRADTSMPDHPSLHQVTSSSVEQGASSSGQNIHSRNQSGSTYVSQPVTSSASWTRQRQPEVVTMREEEGGVQQNGGGETPRRVQERERFRANVDDHDTQEDEENTGHSSDRRRGRTNPFLLANFSYGGSEGSGFGRARRLCSKSEQLNSILDSFHDLQEEENSIDFEVRALGRRKEQVHRQLVNLMKRIVSLSSSIESEFVEERRSRPQLKEVGTDPPDFPPPPVPEPVQIRQEVMSPIVQSHEPDPTPPLSRAQSPFSSRSDPVMAREENSQNLKAELQCRQEEVPETPFADPLDISDHLPPNLAPSEPPESENPSPDGVPNLNAVILTIKEEMLDYDDSENPNVTFTTTEESAEDQTRKRRLPDADATSLENLPQSKRKRGHSFSSSLDGTRSKKNKQVETERFVPLSKQDFLPCVQKLTEADFVNFESHAGSCLEMTVVNDFLVTCSQDRNVHIYNLPTGLLVKSIVGKHNGTISQVLMFDPDDPCKGRNFSVFTACMDQCLREFSYQTGRLQHLLDYSSAIQSMTKDIVNIYLGCHNGEVHLYRSKQRISKMKLKVEGAVTSLKCCSMGGVKCLLVAVKDKGVILADAQTGNEVRRFVENEASVMSMCVIEKFVYAADSARNVVCYAIASGRKIGSFRRKKGCISLVDVHGYLLIAGLGTTIDILDKKLNLVGSIPSPEKAVIFCLEFNKNRLFLGNRSGNVGHYPIRP